MKELEVSVGEEIGLTRECLNQPPNYIKGKDNMNIKDLKELLEKVATGIVKPEDGARTIVYSSERMDIVLPHSDVRNCMKQNKGLNDSRDVTNTTIHLPRPEQCCSTCKFSRRINTNCSPCNLAAMFNIGSDCPEYEFYATYKERV